MGSAPWSQFQLHDELVVEGSGRGLFNLPDRLARRLGVEMYPVMSKIIRLGSQKQTQQGALCRYLASKTPFQEKGGLPGLYCVP
jgi:hypothetical protein